MPDPARNPHSGQVSVRLPRPTISSGDFYTDGRELYQVVLVDGDGVLMENARTLFMVQVTRARVMNLRLVRAATEE